MNIEASLLNTQQFNYRMLIIPKYYTHQPHTSPSNPSFSAPPLLSTIDQTAHHHHLQCLNPDVNHADPYENPLPTTPSLPVTVPFDVQPPPVLPRGHRAGTCISFPFPVLSFFIKDSFSWGSYVDLEVENRTFFTG